MSFIVGLTGGIASGKTTVANLFHQYFQIDIIDADVIARLVVEPNSQGLNAIVHHFGHSILTSDNQLNRVELRARIFKDEAEKEWLNHLLHPMIRQEMQYAITQVKSPYALLVVPLLIENQLQDMVDRILVVDVDENVQIERTQTRDNVSREQALAIMAAQATRAQRLAYADDIIHNNSNNEQLSAQITLLHEKYLAMCHHSLSE